MCSVAKIQQHQTQEVNDFSGAHWREMREAVGHGWREFILPFVCQGRLESDVLCVILEEDWRPWQTSGNEEADPRNQDVRCCHGVIRSTVGLYNVAAQQDADCGLIWYSWEGKEGKKKRSQAWSHGCRPHREQS